MKENANIKIKITRTIKNKTEKTYNFYILDNKNNKKDFFEDTALNHKISSKILKMLPFIFYFDDFRDKFEGTIAVKKITTTTKAITIEGQEIKEKIEIKYNTNEEMVATLDRIFIESYKEASEEKSKKVVKDLFTMDSKAISRTEAIINKTINRLINDKWTMMQKLHNEEETMPEVKLRITKEPGSYTDTDNKQEIVKREEIIVEFLVKEKMEEDESFFNIQDRSKGFLWFFTFILKTAFNPNKDISKENAIYLLDEPGCYLHSSAQKGLCEVLLELSKDSVVIYNTHSHFLLKEDFLPNIKIASKNKEKNISLDHFTQYKERNPEALEPIRSALKVSPSILENQLLSKDLLIVEGLTDFYSWNLFIPKDKASNIGIVPSDGAGHAVNLLTLMLASNKNPICLFDNDDGWKLANKKYPKFKDFFRCLNDYKATIESFYDDEELNKLAKDYDIDNYQGTLDEKKRMIPIIYKKSKNDIQYIKKNLSKTNKNFNDYWRQHIQDFWKN